MGLADLFMHTQGEVNQSPAHIAYLDANDATGIGMGMIVTRYL